MSVLHDQIINILNQILIESPYTPEINLESKEIYDLSIYIEELVQFKHLKKLSLYGNRIEQLPNNMHELVNLEELDLSQNKLDKFNVRKNIITLKKMPKLKKLIYPMDPKKHQETFQILNNLQQLNGLKPVRMEEKKKYEFVYMNMTNLGAFKDKLSRSYEKIIEIERSYLDEVEPNSMDKFDQENQEIINESINKLNMNSDQITPTLQKIVECITKYQLYDNLKMRANNIALDIYADLGKQLKDINEFQDQIFKNLAEQSLKLTRVQYRCLELQRQKENNDDTKFENKIIKNANKLQKQVKRLKKVNDQLTAEINQIQSENKQYLNLIVRLSKGEKNIMAGFQFPGNKNQPRNNISVPTNVIKPLDSKPIKSQGVPSHNITSNFSHNVTQNYQSLGSRLLTIKQLKDTIEQIYESKLKFDQKNYDGKIARETMHQYLFTYLNQKYGLKNLTIEAASSIISGVQAYSAQDNDVAVFGKILRNQIDEEFRNVQSQLKATISSLLKMHIKNQYPYKNASELQEIYSQKINGQITAEESTNIISYLYNQNDSQKLLVKLQALYKIHKPKEDNLHRRMAHQKEHNDIQRSKLKIKYGIFLKAVLDFQLKNHEKLIKPFVQVFKMRDRDNDGIVNEEQFVQIIEDICEDSDSIIQNLLMIVDPYETKMISFTQMVRLVANYPENNPILSRFIDKQEKQDDQ